MSTIELLPVLSALAESAPSGLVVLDDEARLAALARYRIVDTIPEQAYDDVVEIAASLVQAPVALLTLLERNRQWFKAKVGTELESAAAQQSLCQRLMEQPTSVLLIEDTHNDHRFMSGPLAQEQPWIRFYMGAALITDEGHVIGSLCLFDTVPRQVSEQHVQALAALARQAMHLLDLRLRNHEIRDLLSERSVQMQEMSMQHVALKRHNQYLQRASLTDGLTGLLNRTGLDQHLVEAYASARHRQQPLSVLLIDADHFKKYNDEFGHPAGDAALRQLALILKDSCRREGDVAARYGGEEFMLILPNTSQAAAHQLANRLCTQVGQTVFPHRVLTLSIGVATWPDSGIDASVNTLVEQADNALYRAKQLGRNQVAVALS
jgi:diguanylate cyclase (GGDEF)-like protein